MSGSLLFVRSFPSPYSDAHLQRCRVGIFLEFRIFLSRALPIAHPLPMKDCGTSVPFVHPRPAKAAMLNDFCKGGLASSETGPQFLLPGTHSCTVLVSGRSFLAVFDPASADSRLGQRLCESASSERFPLWCRLSFRDAGKP